MENPVLDTPLLVPEVKVTFVLSGLSDNICFGAVR